MSIYDTGRHGDYSEATGVDQPTLRPSGQSAPTEYFETFEDQLDHVLGNVKDLLMAKNAAYGDAALDPLRFHSSASPIEQIKVRMDDKLSRMVRGKSAGEDASLDYVGYYFMLKIAELREGTA